jgi:DNA-binding CsgD family transcriptional regulator
MSNTDMHGTFVMLCDWRGRCIWTSAQILPVEIGEPVWKNLKIESQEQTKVSIGKVIAARDVEQLEVVDREDNHYRGWLWPLDSPEVAVCILGLRIPRDLSQLTDSERACLELLAQGTSTRAIANKLGVSVSTIHTHFRHAREKLGLPTIEALISFAARYCYPTDRPFDAPPGQRT